MRELDLSQVENHFMNPINDPVNLNHNNLETDEGKNAASNAKLLNENIENHR
jgi:hypothetical protein